MIQYDDTEALAARIEILETEITELKKKISNNYHAVRYLSVHMPYDEVKVSDAADFERPFDNVRAVFDKETGNLIYIGLTEDLPF